VACSCKHNNEPFGSIKGNEFLGQLSDYMLLNKESATHSWLARQISEMYAVFINDSF
jgi:hypothetical protein